MSTEGQQVALDLERYSRYDQMRARCRAFHDGHPEVWDLFVRFTFERIWRGFKNYSADAIFHRIRWEMAQPTYEKGKEFKLNDHYTAFYGRRFMRLYPEHDGFFRLRRQTSKDDDACSLPELTPQDFDS